MFNERNKTMNTLSTITFHLTVDETNLILEALGQLPFCRVYNLIGQMQERARQQLQAEPAALGRTQDAQT
jgi:hypothetical protein